jgi:hypothetical protein
MRLDNVYPGETVSVADLSELIIDSKIEDDICQLEFDPKMLNYFGERLLIGELTQLKTIINVQIIFYDENYQIVFDDFGNPIQYTSTPHDLGHHLDILHQGFTFSYVKCLLRFKPDWNFDLTNIFFHFPQSSSILSQSNKQLKC